MGKLWYINFLRGPKNYFYYSTMIAVVLGRRVLAIISTPSLTQLVNLNSFCSINGFPVLHKGLCQFQRSFGYLDGFVVELVPGHDSIYFILRFRMSLVTPVRLHLASYHSVSFKI